MPDIEALVNNCKCVLFSSSTLRMAALRVDVVLCVSNVSLNCGRIPSALISTLCSAMQSSGDLSSWQVQSGLGCWLWMDFIFDGGLWDDVVYNLEIGWHQSECTYMVVDE